MKQEFTIYVRGKVVESGLTLDEKKYAICGQLQKGVPGEETVQLQYKLMEEDEDEDDEEWEQQEFTVPAKETSFELSLHDLRGIQDGLEYAVRIRYFQRWYLRTKSASVNDLRFVISSGLTFLEIGHQKQPQAEVAYTSKPEVIQLRRPLNKSLI